MTDDLCGDTLSNFAFRFRVNWQREIGMCLDVDEARRRGETLSRDDLAGCARVTYSGNAGAVDRLIGSYAGMT